MGKPPSPPQARQRSRPDRAAAAPAPRHFVIQEHHASSLHWDFRLERDGVLVSWAVPKGLPMDKATNHLAVHVEDHPLEYGDFSGTIPEGEYGGGVVTIWDKGTYEEEKWSDREVMVVLQGKRAKGRYVLFATKGKNWMIHRMDEAPPGWEPLPGLVPPMLAVAGSLPSEPHGWAYEFKWDGVRAIAYVEGGRPRFLSRNGNDLTGAFPELRPLGEALGARQVILDGEIVAFDEEGRPRFQLLQPRLHAAVPEADGDGRRPGRRRSARSGAPSRPAVYVVFDVLHLDGSSHLDEPYSVRRRLLESLEISKGANWTIGPSFPGPGGDVLAASLERGLEGVVAKRTDSRYQPGRRSPAWRKVKNFRTQEVVVGGYTAGEGKRSGTIGSLLLGLPSDGGGLDYVGQVGTGFSEEILRDLGRIFAERVCDRSPFSTKVPANYAKKATWLEPDLVGEVAFSEWTTDGRLRQPAWRGLRTDKSAAEVVREP
jgi:bifunctional non-homologous end joining protein LigD